MLQSGRAQIECTVLVEQGTKPIRADIVRCYPDEISETVALYFMQMKVWYYGGWMSGRVLLLERGREDIMIVTALYTDRGCNEPTHGDTSIHTSPTHLLCHRKMRALHRQRECV